MTYESGDPAFSPPRVVTISDETAFNVDVALNRVRSTAHCDSMLPPTEAAEIVVNCQTLAALSQPDSLTVHPVENAKRRTAFAKGQSVGLLVGAIVFPGLRTLKPAISEVFTSIFDPNATNKSTNPGVNKSEVLAEKIERLGVLGLHSVVNIEPSIEAVTDVISKNPAHVLPIKYGFGMGLLICNKADQIQKDLATTADTYQDLRALANGIQYFTEDVWARAMSKLTASEGNS